MLIKILSTGSSKCKRLSEATEEAARELGVKITLEEITDVTEILSYSITCTPALVVNGTVKAMGRVPTTEEFKAIFKQTNSPMD